MNGSTVTAVCGAWGSCGDRVHGTVAVPCWISSRVHHPGT